jgi:uncharacterized protein YabE (DUF348 family)
MRFANHHLMRKKLPGSKLKQSLARHKERVRQLPKHPYIVPISVFLMLFFVGCAGVIFMSGHSVASSDSHVVRLHLDGKEQVLPTRATTVGDFIKRLNLGIQTGDVIEPDLDSPITEDNFNVNVYRAQPVTIVDNGKKTDVTFSAQRTPKEIVKKAGVTVYPEDNVAVQMPQDVVKEGIIGTKVVIDRATPANLNLYGTPAVVRSHSHTVRALLAEKNVKLGQGDTVQPALDTPLTPGVQIFVIRMGTQIASVEESIPMPVEVVQDDSLSAGSQAIRQKGALGKKLVTYQIELQNGKEVKRTKIQETTIQDPVKTIIARGPAGSFAVALAKLRSCEGAYTTNTGNGYYGAYQFNAGTWHTNAPAGFENMLPNQAPPEIQDQAATNLYKRSGWHPWPACSNKLGLQDIYR